MDSYIQRLLLTNRLREPALRAAVQTLQLPPGSYGMDCGCGIGLHTVLLAETVGPSGHVVGLDLSPEFLVFAGEYAGERGLSARVSFQAGDVNSLPFENDTFDWIWSADTIHPNPSSDDPLAALKELARTLKPGGTLALLYWSSQKLLPGYPLLEARLEAAFAACSPYTGGVWKPEFHLLRGLAWLRAAGLEGLSAHTFAADVHAPLNEEISEALTLTLQMFADVVQPAMSAEDWTALRRLCQPESPEFILSRPDYYAFLTYALFQGTKKRS